MPILTGNYAITLILFSVQFHCHNLKIRESRVMPAPKKSSMDASKLALYERLIATVPDVERKGATHPYTSFNGNMFSCLHPPGSLALRLPAGEREKFLKTYKTTLFQSYGVVQKEYVTVPDSLLQKTKELQKYFESSYKYVRTLKAKPSKKKA